MFYLGDWSQNGAIEAIAAIIWEPALISANHASGNSGLASIVIFDEKKKNYIKLKKKTKARSFRLQNVYWLTIVELNGYECFGDGKKNCQQKLFSVD